MKRTLFLLLICAMLAGLTGCGSPFNRSYSSVTTHQAQAASDEDASILRAESYADLVSCVQHFVSMSQATGTVHVYQYSGDIESDLHAACQEVLTEDPLGAFALSDVEFTFTRIVSYYECTFTFTYSRTPAEIAAVVTAYGYGPIRDLVRDTMAGFEPKLTIKTLDFYASRASLLSLAQEAYYSAPETAFGYPSISISIYPDSGNSSIRIIEFSFRYQRNQLTELEHAEAVAEVIAQMVGQDSAADFTVAWLLYSRLLDQVEYAPDGSASVYDALCSGRANSEGIALAYAALCQSAGIDCQLVQGTLNGVPYCWNLITADGTSWHLDLTRADSETAFLHSDEFMSLSAYNWSQEDYPTCDGEDPAVAALQISDEETSVPIDTESGAVDSPGSDAPLDSETIPEVGSQEYAGDSGSADEQPVPGQEDSAAPETGEGSSDPASQP